ncbi:MAG: septal ring lytic transglycosylase RlpA family protein, partial [Acidobacteria bacterium]|nr:septal ring lytic transglycosylase RlpA family protein [Acidobacteriota bacterium]
TTALMACGERAPETNPPAVNQAGAMTPLSSERIAELAERIPELGTEPLPEPQPRSDATPGEIPPRVAGALKVLESVTGDASFYADKFEGRRTASGIPFRQNQMVAAHRAYPFGTILRVTNLDNERSVNVRVVDRGPFGTSAKAKRRIIDLSRRAAGELGFVNAGHARVRVEVLQWGRGIRS